MQHFENLFSLQAPKKEETLTEILRHQNVTINKIISPPNFKSEIFCQEEDEWVTLLQGEALLQIGEKELAIQAGESVFIPKRVEHRVVDTSTEPLCIWLAVHIFEDIT